MKTYTVRGTTNDFLTCDLCGRSDLKSTVALQDQEGTIVHFGSDCAARAAGWTTDELTVKVNEARAQEQAARSAAAESSFQSWNEWLVATTGEVEVAVAIRALGGFSSARQMYGEQAA